jgi:hypothetical protein
MEARRRRASCTPSRPAMVTNQDTAVFIFVLSRILVGLDLPSLGS